MIKDRYFSIKNCEELTNNTLKHIPTLIVATNTPAEQKIAEISLSITLFYFLLYPMPGNLTVLTKGKFFNLVNRVDLIFLLSYHFLEFV